MTQPDLEALAAETCGIYGRNAARFDAERGRSLGEKPWLDRLLALAPSEGEVLDLGCGAGEPIARYLIEQGARLTGADFSEPMLALARRRFPRARWIHADMRALDLGRRFDAVICWHSLHHLTPDEQRAALGPIAAHVRPGGALLATVGDRAGAVTGHVGDDLVYHASLARAEYEAILGRAGFAMVAFVARDPACGEATVLLAVKQAEAG